ncbi:uncharacterized protein BXZ73DRAFT_103144 [Epithele typhae]|uniref:uncharacterized protein n=1 Tax=Epithele typhae TaxID=378194 RepID=UPI002008313F|nr:uncharacterized protein BXZ73DRAFT_103144 [Epithele typhae]KAH9925606.1 hypothetical protein BXZ73DRAFT_103144 [Epithele typhae]
MPLSITYPSNTSSPLSPTNSRAGEVQTCSSGDVDLHCAVTGQCDATLLHRTQIIPFDTPREQLDKLEFSWGVGRNSIDVDSPRNIIALETSLGVLFGTNDDQPTGWFLIPAEEMLFWKVFLYETSDKKGDINNCYRGSIEFSYYLVAFPSMKKCSSVVKYTGDASSEGQLRSDDIQRFRYPFIDFGPIYLPVPYHYIAVHTGAKLLRVYPEGLSHYRHFLPYDALYRNAIYNVAKIYQHWMGTEPPTEWAPLTRHLNEHAKENEAASSWENATSTGEICDDDDSCSNESTTDPEVLEDYRGRDYCKWTDSDIEARASDIEDLGVYAEDDEECDEDDEEDDGDDEEDDGDDEEDENDEECEEEDDEDDEE